MSLAKVMTVCAALVAGGATLAPESASADGWRYQPYRYYGGRIGTYGHRPYYGYSHRSHYPSYGYGRSWYHDTSHWDYHPGYTVWHGDHYDYIPGHYHWHQDGHWHR